MEKDITKILNKYSFNVKLCGSATSPIRNNVIEAYNRGTKDFEYQDDFYVSVGLALWSKTEVPLKLALRVVNSSVSNGIAQLALEEKTDITKYLKGIFQNAINTLGYNDEVHTLFRKSVGANWKELNKLLRDYYIIAFGATKQGDFTGLVTRVNNYYSVSSDEWVRVLKLVTKDGECWVDWNDLKDVLVFIYFKI